MMDLPTAGAIFIMGCYCLAALIDFRQYRLPDWLTWPAAIISVPVSLEMGRTYPDGSVRKVSHIWKMEVAPQIG